jgi:hypothetical protein
MGAELDENLPVLEPLPAGPEQVDFNSIIEIAEMNGVSDAMSALVDQGVSPAQAGKMLEAAGFSLSGNARPEQVGAPSQDDIPTMATGQETRRAGPVSAKSTGSRVDLSFIQRLNDPNLSDEQATAEYQKLPPALRYVYDRTADFSYNNQGSQTPAQLDPRDAAGWLDEFYKNQNSKTPEQNDPAKRAEAAAKQAEVQEAYRQEIEYQRSLTTLNDGSATNAQKRAARMQIEALSAGIGKRINPKLGTSAAAMNEAKNTVGYIGAYEYNNPLADFGSRISTMQRNSQERLGLLRQQMQTSGIPLPEAAPTPAAPNPAQMVLERFGVKAPDGNPVMLNGSPVVSFKRAGKDVMARQTPNGGFVELTAEESAALRGQ